MKGHGQRKTEGGGAGAMDSRGETGLAKMSGAHRDLEGQ